jgi:hypothetical protein
VDQFLGLEQVVHSVALVDRVPDGGPVGFGYALKGGNLGLVNQSVIEDSCLADLLKPLCAICILKTPVPKLLHRSIIRYCWPVVRLKFRGVLYPKPPESISFCCPNGG